MTAKNKRAKNRVSTKNLISYVCTDESNAIVETGMGRTLNVSESGIMLETHSHIDVNLTILLSLGLEENLIDIKGKVIHSTSDNKGKYTTGIQFIELEETARMQLNKFIEAFKSS